MKFNRIFAIKNFCNRLGVMGMYNAEELKHPAFNE